MTSLIQTPGFRRTLARATLGLSIAALAACAESDAAVPGAHVSYGGSVAVGNGTARAYVSHADGVPTEIGVALSERALEGLPARGSGHHGAGMETHEHLLQLPAGHGTPFTFLEMNWNPHGHEPEGVYQDVPHFDFHFYTISRAERDAIDPADPRFAEKAGRLPAPEYVPEHNVILAPPGAPASAVAVPKMGVHWVDRRSHELQAVFGNPDGFRPFTATFIHGTWDGRVHFWEPMITRAHLLEKKATASAAVRDETIPLPQPARVQVPGYYPGAYRITWDPQAREYRVALTRLARRG